MGRVNGHLVKKGRWRRERGEGGRERGEPPPWQHAGAILRGCQWQTARGNYPHKGPGRGKALSERCSISASETFGRVFIADYTEEDVGKRCFCYREEPGGWGGGGKAPSQRHANLASGAQPKLWAAALTARTGKGRPHRRRLGRIPPTKRGTHTWPSK